jgi:L-ascorbate 6-phosphate lactonase
MNRISELTLGPDQAALWFLGQAGCILRASNITLAIDPYLTDSAAAGAPEFTRRFPAPIRPEDLRVDFYLVTHDHLDHLDPETIQRYPHRDRTRFIAPRLAGRKLCQLGVPEANLCRVDVGEEASWPGLTVSGVFALPTSPDVLDTTGYLVRFANGRTVYHTSDTAFTPLLLQAAPRSVEVMLVPINGKWGNLTVEQAADLTAVVGPRYVLPNHHDLMALNAENPETFKWFCRQRKLGVQYVVPKVMSPLVWE